MKLKSHALARCGLAVLLLLTLFRSHAEAKSIRLRNEIIVPESARGAALATTQDNATSGLFLIQFVASPPAEWRRELESLGVKLLRYVPEDAFVAEFDGAPPSPSP